MTARICSACGSSAPVQHLAPATNDEISYVCNHCSSGSAGQHARISLICATCQKFEHKDKVVCLDVNFEGRSSALTACLAADAQLARNVDAAKSDVKRSDIYLLQSSIGTTGCAHEVFRQHINTVLPVCASLWRACCHHAISFPHLARYNIELESWLSIDSCHENKLLAPQFCHLLGCKRVWKKITPQLYSLSPSLWTHHVHSHDGAPIIQCLPETRFNSLRTRHSFRYDLSSRKVDTLHLNIS